MPTFPYTSRQEALKQTFAQLRKSAPARINAGYLRQFDIATANETYILSILRFLGIIDDNGSRRNSESRYLSGSAEVFAAGLEKAVRAAYWQLFDEVSDPFHASRDSLMRWFRRTDKTSALVGQRQATTFLTLAALATPSETGSARADRQPSPHRTPPAAKRTSSAQNCGAPAKLQLSSTTPSVTQSAPTQPEGNGRDAGLSVHIEVNLPANGDAATYDAIFASIKKHLMS